MSAFWSAEVLPALYVQRIRFLQCMLGWGFVSLWCYLLSGAIYSFNPVLDTLSLFLMHQFFNGLSFHSSFN